jgi:hypothetical protein
MATVINNPATGDSSGSGMGFLLGTIILVVFALIILYAGVPILRGIAGSVNRPTQISVPDKVDVNVNKSP